MDDNTSITDLMRRRKSCRSYGPRALEQEKSVFDPKKRFPPSAPWVILPGGVP